MRMIEIGSIFTVPEIQKIIRLSYDTPDYQLANAITEVIRPIIKRINRKTGQENEPRYLAYAVISGLGLRGKS